MLVTTASITTQEAKRGDDGVPQWPLKEAHGGLWIFPHPDLLIPSPVIAATSETMLVHMAFEGHLNHSTPHCQTTQVRKQNLRDAK